MMRVASEDLSLLADDASFLSSVDLRMVMSHLACADTPDSPVNAAQLASFTAMAANFPARIF